MEFPVFPIALSGWKSFPTNLHPVDVNHCNITKEDEDEEVLDVNDNSTRSDNDIRYIGDGC